jgi:hypothetical protein
MLATECIGVKEGVVFSNQFQIPGDAIYLYLCQIEDAGVSLGSV